jgi:hypothetical protein
VQQGIESCSCNTTGLKKIYPGEKPFRWGGFFVLGIIFVAIISATFSMKKLVIPIMLAIALFILLFSVFKTKRYTRTHQIYSAFIAALILVYILYTCNSDNP